MILDLMKAQARAHRGYLAWTAAMLTLGVSLAGYAAFSAAQQDAVDRFAAEAYGIAAPWSRELSVGAAEDPSSMALDRLDAILDATDAEGAGTAATLESLPARVSSPVGEVEWWADVVGGVRGAADWDTLLVEGERPGRGEIAMASLWHTRGGVRIGDTVTVTGDLSTPDGVWSSIDLGSFQVSGFLRDGADGRYAARPFDAILEWDDAVGTWDTWLAAQRELDAFAYDYSAGASVGAATETPALEALGTATGWTPPGILDVEARNRLFGLAATAVVLAVAMIGMAFAVGRSQAQARSRWVATARVLGARRSAIAMATAAEVLLVGLFAGAAGAAIAWGAVAAEYSSFAAAHPTALIPPGVDIATWLILAAGALGLGVAAVLGAIPAFWAARVAPAAALKPVVPATEEAAGPRVTSGWILGTWSALLVALVALGWPGDAGGARRIVTGILATALVVGTVPMLMRAARILVAAAARRLARSTVPWELPAGDAILGRLRIAAIPAGVIAIGTAALTAALAWHVLAAVGESAVGRVTIAPWGWLPGGTEALYVSVFRDPFMATAIAGLGALVLVAFASFASGVRASAAEDDARRALGLAAGTARAAMAVRFAVPLLIGVALGMATGLACVLLTFHGSAWDPNLPLGYEGILESQPVGPAWALAHAGNLAEPMIAILLAALLAISIGAAAAAATLVRDSEVTRV
ncbi:FtsX-like permease family protein [Demequina gelatinilytica]|uniref:FtsX-like permease family protein n=1 Tax=Demequina gelatinilytica TaxID=1638980 RepID=UPI0007851902|nr:FtsX-like permease family protein [Demequina gelatinilytica]